MKNISILLLVTIFTFSCVSKKKYVALQQENGEIKSELTKTKVEKEDLENKFAVIQARVDEYNSKIMSLKEDVGTLTQENNSKLDVDNGAVISNDAKASMRETLTHVDANKLSQAKTLKDSMNITVDYNFEKTMTSSDINEDEDISVNINETVVMISISDKMLFHSGCYRVSSKANAILQKLANFINSEPSLEVMVECHTDSRSINTEKIADNWDLSVKRSTSIIRVLQELGVNPAQLIAAGRGEYVPLVSNDTAENRAINRRTRIVVLPKIDQFYDNIEEEMKILSQGCK